MLCVSVGRGRGGGGEGRTGVEEVVVRPLVDVALDVDPLVVRQSVHLMDEHLELDVGVHLVRLDHRLLELVQRVRVTVLSEEEWTTDLVQLLAVIRQSLTSITKRPSINLYTQVV